MGLLVLATTHRLAIDAQRKPRVGVAHLVHDDPGVLPDRVEDARKCPAQGVRRESLV